MNIKSVCFVIAPTGDEDSETSRKSELLLNDILAPAMRKCGYTVVTGSGLSSPGAITAEVIQYIVSAPLVIADLSDGNPNVFYELAVRHAVRKPVIQLITKDQRLPFDITGSRTIRYGINDLESRQKAIDQITEQVRMIEREVSPNESPISVAGAATWKPFDVAQKSSTVSAAAKRKANAEAAVDKVLQSLKKAPDTPKAVKSLINEITSPIVQLLTDTSDDLDVACLLIQNVPEGGYISATSSLQWRDSDERHLYRDVMNRALKRGVTHRKIICSLKNVDARRYETWLTEINDKADLIENAKIKPDAFQLLHHPAPLSVDILISQDSNGECLEMVAGFSGREAHGGFTTKDTKMVEKWLDIYFEGKVIEAAKAHTEMVLAGREQCFCQEFLTLLESARQKPTSASKSSQQKKKKRRSIAGSARRR